MAAEDRALAHLQAAGLRTAVLTNDLAAFHPPEWIERITVIRRFDPLVDLSHVGFLKPQPEAFEHALKELGIPAEAALDVAAEIHKQASAVARTFVDLFIRQIWRPFEQRGSPENDLPEVRDALERLRPLASDSLLAMFQLVMTAAVEDRMGREIERTQKRRR